MSCLVFDDVVVSMFAVCTCTSDCCDISFVLLFVVSKEEFMAIMLGE